MLARRRTALQLALLGAGPLFGVGLYLSGRGMPRDAEPYPDDVCVVAPTHAWDPRSGQPVLAPREIPAVARCPVCGMFPARQPRWAAQVIHSDGRAHFLDSPLSLFHYLRQLPRFARGYTRAGVAAIYVADQLDGRWLPAAQAVYVHGSARLGPMRQGNLPALADEASARRFAALHGGALMRFQTLEHQLPESLQRLAPHRHPELA